MTAFFTDFVERNARTGRPSPTPLKIQRWEDDGGAVLPRLTEGGSSFGCEYASALWRRDQAPRFSFRLVISGRISNGASNVEVVFFNPHP